jgi:uncharacterized protein
MTHIRSYRRPLSLELEQRLAEPRRFMQIVIGPRQVGKTTLVRQALQVVDHPVVSIAADDLTVVGSSWLAHHWAQAREAARRSETCILAIDEIQKLDQWSELVKRFWDEDTRSGVDVRVVLTGSSAMLLRRGLSESLAGRFEVLRAAHWSYQEMRTAFDCTLDEYLLFGGYPGPVGLIPDRERWTSYMRESIIESTLANDVLQMERIDKPALLRNLFVIGASMSGQIVSLQKMLGQLQDSGNAATIAHYLQLLSDSGLLVGLQNHANAEQRRRASSPKLIVTAPALMTAIHGVDAIGRSVDPTLYGRVVESAVGARLLQLTQGTNVQLRYWRQGHDEVDFVLVSSTKRTLVEVKSGETRMAYRGFSSFTAMHGDARTLIVGAEHVSLEQFFTRSLAELI